MDIVKAKMVFWVLQEEAKTPLDFSNCMDYFINETERAIFTKDDDDVILWQMFLDECITEAQENEDDFLNGFIMALWMLCHKRIYGVDNEELERSISLTLKRYEIRHHDVL